MHEIYLIPGFFGFANLGKITYFHHVTEQLEAVFEDLGHEVAIHSVHTLPTGSIPTRVQKLVETIDEHGEEGASIHIVGHSTGGLDARLLVTPGMSIPGVQEKKYAERVESIVTIATPHYGTPTAALFDGLFGQKLLYIMSLGTIFTLRFGKLPFKMLVKLIGLISKIDNQVGLQETILDQFYRDLFSQFDPELEEEIREFLDHIVADRSAVGQLTPGSIDLFNAAVADHPDIRYGSVVTRAPDLSFDNFVAAGFNPYKQASHGLFQVVHQVAGRGKLKLPEEVSSKRRMMRAGFDTEPDENDNDGMVPTLSQPWGKVIAAVRADHLDVCGHFDDPTYVPPHVDWLVSGSKFRRPSFERLWRQIGQFVAGG